MPSSPLHDLLVLLKSPRLIWRVLQCSKMGSKDCAFPSVLTIRRSKITVFGTATGALETAVAVTMNEVLLRGCTLKNSGFAVGLVVYTGPESRIQMNANEPPHKVGAVPILCNSVKFLSLSHAIPRRFLRSTKHISGNPLARDGCKLHHCLGCEEVLIWGVTPAFTD